jgi:hypothetical protein
MGNQPLIEHYTAARIPNPYPEGELPWQIYHAVRNSVLRCCRRFGTAGPMGERPITADADTPDSWPLGDPEPTDFFVVDDQLNHERYIYVEVESARAFTKEWLLDLMHSLGPHSGWGVGIITIEEAYILAFADKLMVTGTVFGNCSDIDCIVTQVQAGFARSL